MSNRRKARAWVLLPPIAALAACAACASAPGFQPSSPLEKTRTAQEGLLLCNEYRPPEEFARPVVMKPFLTCVDEVAETHRSRLSEPIRAFREELRQEYGLLRDSSWSRAEGLELERAIHTALRALATDGRGEETQSDVRQLKLRRATEPEKEALQKRFPRTARALGASDWQLVDDGGGTGGATLPSDPRLDQLQAGWAALKTPSRPNGAAGQGASSGEALRRQAERCQVLARLGADLDYLRNLWRDQLEMTRLAPGSRQSAEAREKYQLRLAETARALEAFRSQSDFQPGSCP